MTEVLRALRDGSLKVEERLKVACAVARNENLGLPGGKITFLAKWTGEEICSAYNKRNRQDTVDHAPTPYEHAQKMKGGPK